MNKNILILFAFIFLSSTALAQSLNDQINAVDEAQRRHLLEQERVIQLEREEAERRASAIKRSVEKRKADELAEKKRKAEEILADKKREQAYEDQLRSLEIQRRSLQLDMEKAKTSRVNDYIDQELKAQAAQTDVIKSQADATRDLAAGKKNFLEKTGEAEVKRQSGVFK